MALFGGVTRFLDKYLFGYALGVAAGPSLQPFVQNLANEAWRLNSVLPPDAALLAEGVSHGQVDRGWAVARANEQGISTDAFDRLVAIADTGPGVASAFTLWRRGVIGEAAFRRALKREGLEAEWIDALAELHDVLLSPAELANAVVQGHREFGPAAADAVRQGVSGADFQTLVDNTGLPPGPETGLVMLRRGILSEGEFDQLVREGHTKTKYIDPLLALREQILTATQWVNAWLRGHATEAQAKAGGAAQGYSAEQMELLYQSAGRPATTRQVHIGYARGGVLPGAADEREAFSRSVKQSNLRPEYEDILWEGRFTYPSAFVIRSLAQAGTFSEAETRTILIESGWKPEWADLAAADWSGGETGPVTDKWVTSARSRAFTIAWGDFLDPDADEGNFRATMTAIGIAGAAQNTIVTLATAARSHSRRELTQAQVLKLYRRVIWTRDQAQAWLEDAGMTAEDASALLDTVGP